MATLDLDAERAKRAAQAEATGGHEIILGGKTFRLPAILPFDFGEACRQATTEDGVRRAIRILLGQDQYAVFAEQQTTYEDLMVLVEGVPRLYGFESPGESVASSGSSRRNGSRSRPTSKRSTDSTSATPAGETSQRASAASVPS